MSTRAAAQSETSVEGARGGVVAGGEMDNYLRYLQTMGKVPLAAWGLRPFSAAEVDSLTTATGRHPWANTWMFRKDSARHFSVLPVAVTERFNSAFPFGSNNNGVWVGRGLTSEIQAGVAAAWGPVTLVLNPMVFRAENTAFGLQPNGQSGAGQFANGDLPNYVDLPQRFGNTEYSRFDWGQSTLRLDLHGITMGVGSANQYWGPASVFPALLGNNAAGIPHVFLGTQGPTNVGVGHVQARLVYGIETQSNFSPVTGSTTFQSVDQSGTRRFMSALVVTFSPAPIPGLEIGAARFFHQAWLGRVGASELTTPFEGLLKNSLSPGVAVPGGGNQDALKNQLASLFGRWVLPHSGFELYAEYAHEDHNADLRDLEEEPDHSRVAMAGFRKVFIHSDSSFGALRAEYIDASEPTLGRHRVEGGIYVHNILLQGHTQDGQLLGADIGVGSPAAASLAWEEYSPSGRNTLYLQRIVQNNQADLFTSRGSPSGAAHLYATAGFERHRFGRLADLTYGAALTQGKRGPSLGRETNLSAMIGLTAHVR
ncbi:MAG: capsule assembly Wzi family protein [Gemmatimonadota bacterium]|nr:capsule assembly Wzi family protein [Gemmatimonadota bacterium]